MKIRMLPAGLVLAVMMSLSSASRGVTAMAKSAASDTTEILSTEQAAEAEPSQAEDSSTEEDTEETDTGKPASATPNSLVQASDTGSTVQIKTYSEEDVPDKSDIGSALGNQDYMFEETDTEAYLVSDGTVVSEPEDDAEKVADVSTYDTVHLTGTNDQKYWEIEYNGEVEYIDSSLITTDKSVIDDMKKKEEEQAQARIDAEKDRIQTKVALLVENTSDDRKEAQDLIKKVTEETKKEEAKTQTKSSEWNGPVLSKSAGKIKGPSGNETYYNLNMSGVISTMRRMGNNDEYWVRDDGCKMLGDYIMCAANLKIHPRGSLVESSLGTCIVCDTGGFVSYDSTRLDIATTW